MAQGSPRIAFTPVETARTRPSASVRARFAFHGLIAFTPVETARTRPSASVRARFAFHGLIALLCCLALGGCAVVYDDDQPAGLESAPELEPDDELVFERELRWWTAPSRQRARLYLRGDGSYLLVRQRWQGSDIYGWATATLNDVGTARLSNALAVADPQDTAPTPGNYDCTYVDSLPATIHIGDESVAYPSLCPPVGLSELARVYGDIVELLLECPLDGSWYEDEMPLAQDECDVIE